MGVWESLSTEKESLCWTNGQSEPAGRKSERQEVVGWEAASAKALGAGELQGEGERPPSMLQGKRDLCRLLGCHRVRAMGESSPRASYCCRLIFARWAADGRMEAGKWSHLAIRKKNIIVLLVPSFWRWPPPPNESGKEALGWRPMRALIIRNQAERAV